MKKNKLISGVALLGIAALTLTGCSKLPQEKIDAANVAIKGAQVSGAESYTANEFIALQDSMKSALVSIEEQNSKFLKNYDIPTKKLESVVSYASVVTALAESKKEALKAEILASINEIKALIEENTTLIAAAPMGKEGATALMAITGELETIQVTVTESNVLLERGEFFASLEKANAGKDKSLAINAELKAVISKFKSAKSK